MKRKLKFIKIFIYTIFAISIFTVGTKLLKPQESIVHKEDTIIVSSYPVVYRNYNRCIKVYSNTLKTKLPIFLSNKEYDLIKNKSSIKIQYTVEKYSYKTNNVTNISILGI